MLQTPLRPHNEPSKNVTIYLQMLAAAEGDMTLIFTEKVSMASLLHPPVPVQVIG